MTSAVITWVHYYVTFATLLSTFRKNTLPLYWGHTEEVTFFKQRYLRLSQRCVRGSRSSTTWCSCVFHEGFRRFEQTSCLLELLSQLFRIVVSHSPNISSHSIMLASLLFVTSTLQAQGSKFLQHIDVQIGQLLCSVSRVARSTPVSCPGMRGAEIIVYGLN